MVEWRALPKRRRIETLSVVHRGYLVRICWKSWNFIDAFSYCKQQEAYRRVSSRRAVSVEMSAAAHLCDKMLPSSE